MLKTSSSMNSLITVTLITVEDDRVDGGDDKLVEKLSKSQRIVKKLEKPQRPEKFLKTIGSEEPSFLTSDIR